MADALSSIQSDLIRYIESLNPKPINYYTYASRVSAFRGNVSRHLAQKKPNPYQCYLRQLIAHFTTEELETLAVLFAGFAPTEVVAGKISATHIRLQAMRRYSNTETDEVRAYFLSVKEKRQLKAIYDSAKNPTRQKIGVPSPLKFKNGAPVYQIEGPRDRLIRQLAAGKYLYGDIGGLTGGFAFYVSREVVGNDHDRAVAHGAVVANVTSLIGSHYQEKGDAKKRWEAPANSRIGSQNHVGQSPRKTDPIKIIPALPKPGDMGKDANASILQLLKTLNR